MKEESNIAIVIDQLSYGGVVKVLGDLLHFTASEFKTITIFLRDFDNEVSIDIPPNAKLLPWTKPYTISSILHKKEIKKLIYVLYNKIMAILSFRNCFRKSVYDARCLSDISGKYDCVIGFHMASNAVTTLTLEKVTAERTILWLHGEKKYCDKDISFYKKLYSQSNKIVVVSQKLKEQFEEIFPTISDKVVTVNNFFNVEKIKRYADESITDFEKDENIFRIVSVGNLMKAKGFDRAIKVMSKIVADGYDVQWYIIGKGALREPLQDEIKQEGLEKRMILMGYRTNPYPYIKQSDLYVQTSYSEGFCTSTMEAKILKTPVITTDCPGMNEQFTNGFDGIIVESSVEGLYNGIVSVLENREILSRIKQNLSTCKVTNDKVYRETLGVIKGE